MEDGLSDLKQPNPNEEVGSVTGDSAMAPCNAEYNESGNVDKHTHHCIKNPRHLADTAPYIGQHLCDCKFYWSDAPAKPESRCTSGPWRTGNTTHTVGIVVWRGDLPANTNYVRICRNVASAADALLIAAAPDLLEACKLLEQADDQWANCANCEEATSFPELCEDCFPLYDEARLARRAAIAKADGK